MKCSSSHSAVQNSHWFFTAQGPNTNSSHPTRASPQLSHRFSTAFLFLKTALWPVMLCASSSPDLDAHFTSHILPYCHLSYLAQVTVLWELSKEATWALVALAAGHLYTYVLKLQHTNVLLVCRFWQLEPYSHFIQDSCFTDLEAGNTAMSLTLTLRYESLAHINSSNIPLTTLVGDILGIQTLSSLKWSKTPWRISVEVIEHQPTSLTWGKRYSLGSCRFGGVPYWRLTFQNLSNFYSGKQGKTVIRPNKYWLYLKNL